MKTWISKFVAVSSLACATSVWAIPTLQLDILGGVYSNATQTTVATSSSFTLRALYKGSQIGDYFYVSAAISPGLVESSPVPNFGSVKVDGTTFLPADYTYGIPPVDVIDNDPDGIDLQTHSIFPTYFLEFRFKFDAAHTVPGYNVQDDSLANNVTLYYHDFIVDVSSLDSAYVLHFDLYHEGWKRGDYGVDNFAPFSKDAESGHVTQVPDRGSVIVLFAMGLVLLAAWRKKSA